MTPIKIALIGIGKIARDEHVPAIALNPNFDLTATVTSRSPLDGIPSFPTIRALHEAMPEVQALSICTPPRGRIDLVTEALACGLDILMEKPPAASLCEARAIVEFAESTNRVLYQTWHSREAAAVEPAKEWLADKLLKKVIVNWKEDVRVWHPGQSWIWEPGIGVFDPGINALSVITSILPGPLQVEKSDLYFPANKASPIAADLQLTNLDRLPVSVAFDFDQRGEQTWEIFLHTENDVLHLTHGASRMELNGEPVAIATDPEYHRLYRQFATLCRERRSDADLSPFELVADAFMLGNRHETSPFDDF